MNRCEAIFQVQKTRGLENGGLDLHIRNELGKARGSLIGLARVIDSHPTATVLHNYFRVKRNRTTKSVNEKQSTVHSRELRARSAGERGGNQPRPQ
jgi:hypothetical protein